MVLVWYFGLALLIVQAAIAKGCTKMCIVGYVLGPNCTCVPSTTTATTTIAGDSNDGDGDDGDTTPSGQAHPRCKDCRPDQQCVLMPIMCPVNHCAPVPKCVPKSDLKDPTCASRCERVTTPDGCITCLCQKAPICFLPNCPVGCKIVPSSVPNQCPKCVCPPATTTDTPHHVCPMYVCGPPCTTKIGSDGCPEGCDCPPVTTTPTPLP